MTRLPALTAKAALSALLRAGFYVHHTTGSHQALRHPDKPGARVVVPHHSGDLKRAVVHSILKQAGLSPEDFLKLL